MQDRIGLSDEKFNGLLGNFPDALQQQVSN